MAEFPIWTRSSHLLIASLFSPMRAHFTGDNISWNFLIRLHFLSPSPFGLVSLLTLYNVLSILSSSCSQLFLSGQCHSKMPEPRQELVSFLGLRVSGAEVGNRFTSAVRLAGFLSWLYCLQAV